jgi:hypothetical protein
MWWAGLFTNPIQESGNSYFFISLWISNRISRLFSSPEVSFNGKSNISPLQGKKDHMTSCIPCFCNGIAVPIAASCGPTFFFHPNPGFGDDDQSTVMMMILTMMMIAPTARFCGHRLCIGVNHQENPSGWDCLKSADQNC